jgi:hypothetical protein
MRFKHMPTVVANDGWLGILKKNQLASLDAVFQATDGLKVTGSRTSEVWRVELRDDDTRHTVFVKKYWFPSAGHCLKGAFRGTFFGPSKVRREYENLHCLRHLGLEAPEPVAYGEERWFGWLTRSYLISAGIANPCPLDRFIRDELSQMPAEKRRAIRGALIERLADCTRQMHDHHFVHHDFFWRNIILSQGSLDHFHLIDAHKGHAWGKGDGWRFRVQDFATLDAPAPAFFRRTERLRFFLRYCGHHRLTARDKSMIKRILRLADPLRSRQLQRVRTAYCPALGITPPVDKDPPP